MKLALASLGLCLAATITLSDVQADDWNNHYTVTASAKKGADGKVTIEVKGKDGWYINTSYPMKITLTPPDGVTIDKKEIGKDSIEFVGTELEGKAKVARATVSARAPSPTRLNRISGAPRYQNPTRKASCDSNFLVLDRPLWQGTPVGRRGSHFIDPFSRPRCRLIHSLNE